MLVWHYCFWFAPEIFVHTPLLDDAITFAWLINLGSSSLTMLLAPLALRNKRYLTSHRAIGIVCPLVLSSGTLYLALFSSAFDNMFTAGSVSLVLGVCFGVLWIYCGEYHIKHHESFDISRVALFFGLTLLASLLLVTYLPSPLNPIFVSILPLIIGVTLLLPRKKVSKPSFPLLLPAKKQYDVLRTVIKVCIMTLGISIACYYLLAIIPWELLPFKEKSFTWGVVAGALAMLVLALSAVFMCNRSAIYRLFPALVALLIVAFALFLADQRYDYAAFLIAVGVASILELLLTAYFGLLTNKGFIAPALAFGMSAGSVRLGFVLGNMLAVLYEHHLELALLLTVPTSLAFVLLLLALLVALVRQEYSIAALTSAPPSESTLVTICIDVAQEFSLSAREGEILHLMAQGYTSNAIAEKLYISPYTVNTHIRHIYEKMNINKKSELLNYVNLQRGHL